PADERAVRRLRWKSAAGPTVFALMAIALLVYDHLNRRVTELVFWLTLVLIVAVFARMIETVRTQSRALQRARRIAISDQVTGLENRRKLRTAVEATLRQPNDRRALVLLELEGLRAYNDRFGYAAGDELLRLFAKSLVDAVTPLGGSAYRIDTNQLAALVPAGEQQLGEVVLAATSSLRELEGDQLISSSYGEVVIPDDANDPDLAFQIAGQRLSAHKQRQHRSARRQAHAVLMAALAARRPDLRDHLRAVTYRAISLGRRLEVGIAVIDDIALAAELQEVGLLAESQSGPAQGLSLNGDGQPGSPSHTVDAEKIIAAAPGLKSVARLVRASSEHYDGNGYPDGLVGEAIPLGSRIIAVAGAFAAMTSPDGHLSGRTPEEALAELRFHAGTRFDPRVVDALAADLAEERTPVPA
ncbi:MAG: HD domain-containing phosphohydrolase, partial [Solirubrobacterales bacterium]